MMAIGRRLLSSLPEHLRGVLEYYCQPALAVAFGPLNGQVLRQQLFRRLTEIANVTRIVETGTYRGTTTMFFTQLGLPVVTIETNERYYAYSKRRLRKCPTVTVIHQDSVNFLRYGLAAEPVAGTTLFYLDAHWYSDLPVRGELETICTRFQNNLIVIDDFEIPNDPGYGFDDYGDGNRLGMDYLKSVDIDVDMMVFFPSAPSAAETGAKRGACVVTSNRELGERLKTMPELRFFGRIAGRNSRGLQSNVEVSPLDGNQWKRSIRG